MKRRVAIRMRANRCNSVGDYCHLLRQGDTELELLQKALTIHVSQFFRNPTMFEKLRNDVLPLLLRHCAETGDPLRLWSLGCAGGEEAYSLVILLHEYFAREIRDVLIQVSGTDIDADTLQAARKGEYLEDRLKDLPEELKVRYFRFNGARYILSPSLRETVQFHLGDIMNVAAYEPHNLVMCRNTLIYFTRPEQEKILHGIADILPAGGILVLGKSETLVGDTRRYFTPVCPVERIYRRS